MTAEFRVGYLVGSLSSKSINRRLALALIRLAPPELELFEIPFRDLPLFTPDLEADMPAPARALKQAVESADAILFVTPEYNRSIPGPLKNAIDWASRPYGKNSFSRKPTGVLGTSTGKIGTAVAQQQLRSVLSYCNAPQMNSPEVYIHFSPPDLIGEDGQVTVPETEEFLRKYMEAFLGFIERVYLALPRPA